MSKRQLFNITYRYAIPAVIVLAFAVTQGVHFSFESVFEWLICLGIASIYPVMTKIDQAPSKSIPYWKQGLPRRYGVFRGDQFLPFYDRSSMKFFYFFSATGSSVFTSVMIALGLPAAGIAPASTSLILSIAHFVFILSPLVVLYPSFMKVMYPKEVGESDYEPDRQIS